MSERKFRTGDAFHSIQEFVDSLNDPPTQLTINEDERQLVLLSLAELSLVRPGWLFALEQIALKMDNRTDEGRAEMFDKLRRAKSDRVAKVLSGP